MDKGILITVKAEKMEDLGRDVIKSEWATIKVEELKFEIPNNSKNGEISTIEGVLKRAYEGLSEG